MKILDICAGLKTNTHMGRKQFYAALKLVAAHQAGLDIHTDQALNSLETATPLPRFSWPMSGDEDSTRSKESIAIKKMSLGSRLPESTTESESDAESPRETGGSTDSPTPTNSVTQERIEGLLSGETILDSASGSWQGLLVSEEQRQLLGTEEESSERHSSDDADGDNSSFPPEEVWIISDEQREYYAGQFARLQPDPEGLIAGHVARTFFEKSRLPVAELRRIWQLADVTRDGALSLQEFYVAMHLVVLRRNHVPLPDVLPPCLGLHLTLPTTVTTIAVAPSPPQPPPPPPTPPNQSSLSSTTTAATAVVSAVSGQSSPNSRKNHEKNKEWTKFVDSPTGTNGSLTSPGPKPVNFDFQKAAVERDPKILHPVPLRLTPEAAILASTANNGNNGSITALIDNDLQHSTVVLVPRPQTKKSLSINNDDCLVVTPKKEPPPPPPPRPYRTHTRSSSLDLNKLAKNGQNFLGAPPSVPPRVSPGVVKRGEGDDDNGKDDTDDGKKLTLQELREKNAELRLICEELTRELAGALQERINLRAKLLLIT
ncbi:hypothetical protein PV327_007918 [Microctonus hyperodae]|nr:hypothetical protein PV327_007918 [Microctonus hyperodae]